MRPIGHPLAEIRSVILRQLTRRVGLVPEATIDRIQQLPIDRLEALAEALLDFTQLNDLVDWLEADGLRPTLGHR